MQLEDYLLKKNLTANLFAKQCGISVDRFYRILYGRPPAIMEAYKINNESNNEITWDDWIKREKNRPAKTRRKRLSQPETEEKTEPKN